MQAVPPRVPKQRWPPWSGVKRTPRAREACRSLNQSRSFTGLAQPSCQAPEVRPARRRGRLFNPSQVKKPAPQLGFGEPKHRCSRLDRTACNHSMRLRVVSQLQQRVAAVGSGTIDVGTKTPASKSGQPIVDQLAGSDGSLKPRIGDQNPLKTERVRICGAMSQQRGDSGNVSAPQKFVRLVGCRDPKARPEPWVRPRPAARER